jgi:thymidylate synthase ThyX
MREREIYLLSPRQLSPETIAVAFAKTSRSPESFRDIASELSEDKSAQFHEKWVVGYGHASVAEHAVLHIAFENISRVAIESIESNRLASYTEKSTRYQRWNPGDFTVPPELEGHPLRDQYAAVVEMLFQSYINSLAPVRAVVEKENPRRDGETDAAWDRRIRSRYVDVCRFLLPAAALANVGMTINARALEHAIRKMLSHPLQEVKDIGAAVKQVAQAEVPTLVKYADTVPYLVETMQDLAARSPAPTGQYDASGSEDWCRLVDYDHQGEMKILVAALYRFGEASYEQAYARVASLSKQECSELAAALLGRLGRFDEPLRELEYSTYTFDLVMDQGAYAEFKRHRMMSQTSQLLTTRLGYTIPRLMSEAGIASIYEAAMQESARVYEHLYELGPAVAQYVVPNGYKRRVLAQLNLRSAYHFCQLRSAPNAHFSIRKIAERVAEEIRRVHPLLSAQMDLPQETWQDVEDHYFTQ